MTLRITTFSIVILSIIVKMRQLVNVLAASKERRTGEDLINILPAS